MDVPPSPWNSFLDHFYAHQRPSAAATDWQGRLRRHGLPVVLPALVKQKSSSNRGEAVRLSVFMIGRDAAEFRLLGDQFRSFLGRTFSDDVFTRLLPNAKTQFIPDHCGQGCYFTRMLVRTGMETEADQALLRWLQVWDQWDLFRLSHPGGRTDAERLRDALRRFREALAAKDRIAALGRLIDIEDRALLETSNRLFLRVQFHANFREWSAILDDRHLSDLIQIRRPASVTEALIQAVYYSRIAPLEDDIPRLWQVFASDVYPAYRPLYRSRGTITSPEVVRSFLLRAVAVPGETDETLRNELLSLPALAPPERVFLQRLSQAADPQAADPDGLGLEHHGKSPTEVDRVVPVHQIGSSTEASALNEVQAAFMDGRDDTALRLIQGVAATEAKAKFLLQFARQDDTLLAGSYALSSLSLLPEPQRTSLLLVPQIRAEVMRLMAQPQTIRPFVSQPEDASQGTGEEPGLPAEAAPLPELTVLELPSGLPLGWKDWLQQLAQRSLPEQLLRKCAEAGVVEWSVEPLAMSATDPVVFADQLDAVRDGGATRDGFLDTLPFIIQAFLEDPGYPRAVFAPIYEGLRLTLSYDLAGRGLNDTILTLFLDLLAGQLAHGVGAVAYRDIMSEVESYWQMGGAANLRALLDLLDALLEFASPDKECREKVARLAFTRVGEWINGRRVGGDQAQYARRLAEEYHQTDLLPAEPPDVAGEAISENVPWDVLNGKSVGLYTLMDSVGNRIRSLLRHFCPGCEVLVNSEKVGGSQLKNLAEGADVFIMVTGCAKHAATEFIEKHRNPQKPLLRPSGRGSSSVLTALAEYLKNASGNSHALGSAAARVSSARPAKRPSKRR